jgi:hypothetical protein
MRYAGIAFFLALSLSLICYLFIFEYPFIFKKFINFSIIPLLTILIIFSRNYTITGHVSGGPSVKFNATLYAYVQSIWYSFKNIIGFYSDSWLHHIMLFAFIVGFIFLFVYFVVQIHQNFNFRKKLFYGLLFPSLLYILFTFILILYYALMNHPSFFSHRFFIPVIPITLIVFSSLIYHVIQKADFPYIVFLKFIFIIVTIIYIFGQGVQGFRQYKEFDTYVSKFSIFQALNENYKHTTIKNFLRNNCNGNCSIMSNKSHFVGMILDVPTIGLTSSLYTRKTWNENNIKKLAKDFDSKYLLIIYNDALANKHTGHNNKFMDNLLHNKKYTYLNPVYTSSNIKLYEFVL